MQLPGLPYKPRYTADETALGIALGILLHLFAIGPFVVKAILPHAKEEEEKPIVSRPVVQAELLRFGKPIDPKRLPDRLVPQQRTAPKKQITASQNAENTKRPDAGAEPPPNTKDSDIENLVDKSDLFAEDAGKPREQAGSLEGVDGGTADHAKAGDAYAAQLSQFFGQRMTIPSVISVGEAKKLCVVMEINIGRNMTVWHVKQAPVIASGNDLLDDAARGMMMKLLDDKTALPNPPKEVDELYRGRTVQVVIKGDPHGDSSRCVK